MSRHPHADQSLRRHGLKSDEWDIFVYVGYASGGSPETIAADAQSIYSEEELPFVLSLNGYLKTIKRCVDRGWLTVLTVADLIQEQVRRQTSSCLEAPENPHLVDGSLDFTSEGYRLWTSVVRDVFSVEHIDSSESFSLVLIPSAHYAVVGRTEKACIGRVGALATTLGITGRDAIRVSEPRKTGRWRPNRFVEYPSGLTVDVEIIGEPK